MALIKCLLCGREFKFLGSHLRLAHGTNAAEYRAAFGIPAGQALASEEYCNSHAEKIRRMQAAGSLTYEHLQAATEAASNAVRPRKTPDDAAKHAEMMRRVKPWAKNQLPSGAKRMDGRDADRAREYQREYRQRKAMPKRTSTYLTDKTLELIGDAESLSGRLNQAADRYAEILRRHRPDRLFSAEELALLKKVCQGWAADPAATIAGGILLELDDAPAAELPTDVDIPALRARLAALSFAAEVALIEFIQRN